jgi:hypothetical protein
VLSIVLAGVTSAMMVIPGLAASSTVTVTPASLSATSWYFYDDVTDIPTTTQDSAHYKFVTGPGSPPAGVGSVFFHNDAQPSVPQNLQQRWDIATSMFGGTPLASLTALKFNTFEPTGEAANHAVFLNFDVNFGNVPVTVPGYQGRLVYVPADNGTVQTNTWQEWDTLSAGAVWRWSHFDRGPDNNAGTPADNNAWPDGNTNPTRTWSDIVASFPNASINATPGSSQLVFRAGEPYPAGFTGYLDKVTVGIGANTTVFDFEPFAVAHDKDDCKGGGWQNLRRADGSSFKNQGDCVSYTNNGK